MEFVLYSVTGTPDGGESYDIALGEPLCRIGTLRIREVSEKVDSDTPLPQRAAPHPAPGPTILSTCGSRGAFQRSLKVCLNCNTSRGRSGPRSPPRTAVVSDSSGLIQMRRRCHGDFGDWQVQP